MIKCSYLLTCNNGDFDPISTLSIDTQLVATYVTWSHTLQAQLTYLRIRHMCTRPMAHWGNRPSAVSPFVSWCVWYACTCFLRWTMACDNCQWTMLDFTFMCGNVTTSAVVPGNNNNNNKNECHSNIIVDRLQGCRYVFVLSIVCCT